jgi:hypothetical protein
MERRVSRGWRMKRLEPSAFVPLESPNFHTLGVMTTAKKSANQIMKFLSKELLYVTSAA